MNLGAHKSRRWPGRNRQTMMIPVLMEGMEGVPARMETVEAMELLKSVHLIIVGWVRALYPPKNRYIREFSQNWCFILLFVFCNFNFDYFGYSFLLNPHLRFDKNFRTKIS